MHRVVLDQMESVLSSAQTPPVHTAESASAWAHLAGCEACRGELATMKQHAQGIRALRAPEEVEPRAGFYARVMERIEAEGPVSIWNLFMESPFGRRIAIASFALAMLLGMYLVSSERSATDPIMADVHAQGVPQNAMPDGSIQVVQDLSTGQITIQGNFDLDPNQLQQMQMGLAPRSANFTEPASDDAELSNFMSYQEQ